MCERSGQILLSLTLIALGVLNFSHPSSILLKTVKHYGTFVPLLNELHLNVILGLVMFLTAVSILMRVKQASSMIQVVVFLNIALQGVPVIPSLDHGEQFCSVAFLMKTVGLFGASLLLNN
jgi:hypothetical protein